MVIVGSSDHFEKMLSLPRIEHSCTVSVVLVDYMTNGQTEFFASLQWLAEDGLVEANVALAREISLVNSCDLVLISKKINLRPSWDNFVKIVVTINNINEEEIYRYEDEYVDIPDEEVENTLHLAASQFSGDCDALLSFERFLTFAHYKNPISYIGKNILVSGCGTGAEVLVCKALGAKYCLGHDIDRTAIEFADRRFKNISNISFTSSLPISNGGFDLVISRHVLEHIPRSDWYTHLSELGRLLDMHGEILIDVPNQNNPREPHTDLLFFHLLSDETKNDIVKYCEITKPAWYLPIREKMKTLINHKNVLLTQLLESVPPTLFIRRVEFIDSFCDSYDQDYADGIRVILQRS